MENVSFRWRWISSPDVSWTTNTCAKRFFRSRSTKPDTEEATDGSVELRIHPGRTTSSFFRKPTVESALERHIVKRVGSSTKGIFPFPCRAIERDNPERETRVSRARPLRVHLDRHRERRSSCSVFHGMVLRNQGHDIDSRFGLEVEIRKGKEEGETRRCVGNGWEDLVLPKDGRDKTTHGWHKCVERREREKRNENQANQATDTVSQRRESSETCRDSTTQNQPNQKQKSVAQGWHPVRKGGKDRPCVTCMDVRLCGSRRSAALRRLVADPSVEGTRARERKVGRSSRSNAIFVGRDRWGRIDEFGSVRERGTRSFRGRFERTNVVHLSSLRRVPLFPFLSRREERN